MRKNLAKNILLLLIVIALLITLWILNTRVNVLSSTDFIEYWAAGRLNLTGGNPYDATQMLTMEASAGRTDNEALMMLNPPWVISYSMFFAIFSYPFSRFLCFILQIFTVSLSAVVVWRIYQGNKRYEWIALIVALAFGPVLHALKSGQVTVVLLLGSVGFLYFVNRKSDFLAGLSACLVLFKPHLLYLFVFSVIIWSIASRRYRVPIGMISGLVISLGISWVVNPQLLAQYFSMLKSYPIENWMTPTLGALLRQLIGADKFYLQFVPSVVGILWFLFYWKKNHDSFNWQTELPLIILVSIVTSPYGWILDSTVSVLSVIQIATLLSNRQVTNKYAIIISAYCVIDLLIILLSVSQRWLWWFPSSLFVWYLFSYLYLAGLSPSKVNPGLTVVQEKT